MNLMCLSVKKSALAVVACTALACVSSAVADRELLVRQQVSSHFLLHTG